MICSLDGLILITLFCYNFDYRLQLKLYKPLVVEKGQRFTLRDGSTTLGTGVFTTIKPNLSETDRMLLTEGKKGIEKRAKKAAAASGKS